MEETKDFHRRRRTHRDVSVIAKTKQIKAFSEIVLVGAQGSLTPYHLHSAATLKAACKL
jgi:hypothetical protein